MNTYRHQFVSKCPNNGKSIIYNFELRKPDGAKVMVEHIVTAAALWVEGYHEQIADDLFTRFGGSQILTAHHHGVDIETQRGFYTPSTTRLAERVIIGKTVYEKGVETALVLDALAK